jgi:multicomponent Na+:H+ antiporter subunit B
VKPVTKKKNTMPWLDDLSALIRRHIFTLRILKYIFLLLAMIIIFFELNFTFMHESLMLSTPYLKEYYLKHFLTDTGAMNSVSAIYLDYRIFDSIFEAGILLIAVTGIIFIAGSDRGDQYEKF